MRTFAYTIAFLVISLNGFSQEPDYDHVFFENSLMPESWYYSKVEYSSPSFVLNISHRLPVENNFSFTPGNCLELNYTSAPDGQWLAQLNFPDWRGKDNIKTSDMLVFWLYTPEPVNKSALPEISLATGNGQSGSLPINNYLKDLNANTWLQVRIPLIDFVNSGSSDFEYLHSKEISSVIFQQGEADSITHRVLIDQIELISSEAPVNNPPVPVQIKAKGYERHVDLSWNEVDPTIVRYIKIYRSENDQDYLPVGIHNPGQSSRYADFTGTPGKKYYYKLSTLNQQYQESEMSEAVQAETYHMNDEQLLDMVQEAHFRYYWEGAEPVSGLALENIPGRKNMIATGASGFGLMALVVGSEKGFITREELIGRLTKVADFIERGDRFHGAVSHFMDGPTGKVEPFFGKYDDGGDLVETSFFIQGFITAAQYLSGESVEEKELKQRLTNIWRDVEWNWYRKTDDSPFLFWHWSPQHEWHINHPLIGWNETLITYFLAIASPTHPVPAGLYYSGWASQNKVAQDYRTNWGQTADGAMYINRNTYFGVPLDVGVSNGGPLFFVHYSFLGLDPRRFTDRFTNYFSNNRNITLINYRYCCENPHNFPGYGKDCWGLTASDGPWGYKAREPVERMDDGTIAPTGALASFPYLPDEAMQALRFYYRSYGHFLWGEYGFRDAFNLKEDWVAPIFMGLNQAPVTVMIENHRSGLLWNLFMSSPDVQDGIRKLNEIGNEE